MTPERRSDLTAEARVFAGRLLVADCDNYDDYDAWGTFTEEEKAFIRDEIRKIARKLQARPDRR